VTVSGANRTLTGSIINNVSTLNGGGFDLTITGNADVDGAITNVANLSVSGTSDLGANFTTSGTQTYTGAVTLSSDVVLSSSNSNIIFVGVITGSAQDLTLSTGSGAITLANVGTNAAYLGDVVLNSSGTTTLGGPVYAASLATDSSGTGAGTIVINGGLVKTSGTQTYREAVTLGADTTLAGSTINTVWTVNGGGSSLIITGNADIDRAITDVADFSVSGTSNLGADITTTGTQTYTGAVTLSGGDRILTGTTINTGSTLNGGGHDLAINGHSIALGAITDITNWSVTGDYSQVGDLTAQTLTVGGDIHLNGSIHILDTQAWVIGNQVTLTGDSAFLTDNTAIEFTNRVLGASHDFTVSTGSGSITLNGAGNSNAFLGDIVLNSSGLTDLNGTFYAASIQTDGGGSGLGTINSSSGLIHTTGTQLYREAITFTNNIELIGALIDSRAVLNAGANNINVTGNADIASLITTASYTQIGNLIADSMAVGGDTNINGTSTIGTLSTGGNYTQNGNVTAQSITVAGNTSITGTANIGTSVTNGTLTLVGTLNASIISVIGDVMLNGTINTTGDQIWTGPNSIILTGDSELVAGGNLDVGRRIYSATGSGNHDLTLEASVDVIIANDIGTAPGVSRTIGATIDNNGLIDVLTVVAGNELDLLADVSTKNLQDYTAISINIGSVEDTLVHNQVNWDLSGTDGYSSFDPGFVKESNPDLVRTLISVDPIIQFNGAVNDTIEGTHSLVTIAIARSRSEYAEIIFASTIGAERKLYSVSARTIEYLEGALSPTDRGTIKVGGNISTVANQNYQTTMFEVLGDAPITIASDTGVIRIVTPAYQMTGGISFDYSFASPPEISAGTGLIRLADILRDVPSSDISSGVLSNKLLRMAIFSDETNDSVDAEVEVGDIESGDDIECKPGQDPAECKVEF
jgi:hypothetical protein